MTTHYVVTTAVIITFIACYMPDVTRIDMCSEYISKPITCEFIIKKPPTIVWSQATNTIQLLNHAFSRAVDFIEFDIVFDDARNIAVVGHSRQHASNLTVLDFVVYFFHEAHQMAGWTQG